jgi:hypothetical protein
MPPIGSRSIASGRCGCRLGRRPDPAEVSDLLPLTEGFGSYPKALRFLAGRQDPAELEAAQRARIADLSVYLALNQFERRRPYGTWSPGCSGTSRPSLAITGRPRRRRGSCCFASATPRPSPTPVAPRPSMGSVGWSQASPCSSTRSLIEQLPPLLRVYIGCAAVLYGDPRNADLVKVHIGSGKVSLMRYDDFEGRALPRMVERVKIKLREQDVDYFAYGEGTDYAPPYLFRKSRFINEEFPGYPEQVAFEEALEGLGAVRPLGLRTGPGHLRSDPRRHRWQVEGFRLQRVPPRRRTWTTPAGAS